MNNIEAKCKPIEIGSLGFNPGYESVGVDSF